MRDWLDWLDLMILAAMVFVAVSVFVLIVVGAVAVGMWVA